jgi:hypothetical protein
VPARKTRGNRGAAPLAGVESTDRARTLLSRSWLFSLTPYGVTAEVLTEILPIGSSISNSSLHRNVEKVAARLESELGEEKGQFIEGRRRDWQQLPRPNPPPDGLNGEYVHTKDQNSRTELV